MHIPKEAQTHVTLSNQNLKGKRVVGGGGGEVDNSISDQYSNKFY